MPRASFSLHKKVLLAFCLLSLLPLLLLVGFSSRSLRSVESQMLAHATRALDQQAAEALELRAGMVAAEVEDFLRQVTADLRDLSQLPVDERVYREFYRHHLRPVWFRRGSNAAPGEAREERPLYTEIAWVAADGRELLRLADGLPAELRDISAVARTTYGSEDYFLRARALPPGGVHVTRVTGRHLEKQRQLAGAPTPEAAVEGERYRGVIRFSMPVHADDSSLLGVAVLSLDHRHLMEFTQHILPHPPFFTVFSSYDSGNYAFMFDDEGWMIAHPKHWNLRGLDERGQPVPPYTAASPPELVERGIIPFNLFHAGFVHPNYPVVAAAVLRGESGVADVTNIGGSEKIMAYAPIRFGYGEYAAGGIFGGVTIGAEVSRFHAAALSASAEIRAEMTRFVGNAVLMILATALLVVAAAYLLSRGITRPLSTLIDGTQRMARGELDIQVPVTAGDEIGELAVSFNRMAEQLKDRQEHLLATLDDLDRSRREILRERDFKEILVETIDIGLLTLDGAGRVTSVNGPAARLLGLSRDTEGALDQALAAWPSLLTALAVGLQQPGVRWHDYADVDVAGRPRVFRLSLVPSAAGAFSDRILTIEDLTERVEMRRQLARMERMASLGRLSAGIAHEVRNPLTGISLLLDDLHDRLLSQPADQELIRRALSEIERLEELVSGLLDFAASPLPRLEPANIGTVLRETLFLIGKPCERRGIHLVEDLAEDLPSFPLDAHKLKQAFLNLFNNALDAMPAGGRLDVAGSRLDRELRILIPDCGAGIPAETLPLIIEPFYTGKGSGTGLGLSITQNILADHGGRIRVTSTPGVGSEFTLFLPILEDIRG